MELSEFRKHASNLSGGTSSQPIKNLIIRLLDDADVKGSVLDFGAGRGELLRRLHSNERFARFAGMDLFDRPHDLPPDVEWLQRDLNEPFEPTTHFDVVVCSETIEHLENPRHTFRTLFKLLNPDGLLVLTMPNQESLRSYAGLVVGGHFASFLGDSYPAHITALLRLDLKRIASETGFSTPGFHFTNDGGIPKFPSTTWQKISFDLLKGRLFSDNVAMVCRKARPH